MLWIKEVEMVDSVDDLKSSRSIQRNKQNHPEPASRKKVSLEEMKAHKEDRFLRGRQIAYLIYEYFGVTGANDSVESYADILQLLFEMMIFRNSFQNGTKFYCRLHKSHPMTSWKACINQEYECLRNSRPYWNIVQYGDSSEGGWT